MGARVRCQSRQLRHPFCAYRRAHTTRSSVVASCVILTRRVLARPQIGQTLAAIAQAFILFVPARLSAVWFGADEKNLSTALGVMANQVRGFAPRAPMLAHAAHCSACRRSTLTLTPLCHTQLGVAVGFLVGPLLVDGGDGMEGLLVAEAAFATVGAVLVLLLFANEPPVPPSYAAISAAASGTITTSSESCVPLSLGTAYAESCSFTSHAPTEARACRWRAQLRVLACNRAFLFLLSAYGANVGMYVDAGVCPPSPSPS